jgi:hypothetical protein
MHRPTRLNCLRPERAQRHEKPVREIRAARRKRLARTGRSGRSAIHPRLERSHSIRRPGSRLLNASESIFPLRPSDAAWVTNNIGSRTKGRRSERQPADDRRQAADSLSCWLVSVGICGRTARDAPTPAQATCDQAPCGNCRACSIPVPFQSGKGQFDSLDELVAELHCITCLRAGERQAFCVAIGWNGHAFHLLRALESTRGNRDGFCCDLGVSGEPSPHWRVSGFRAAWPWPAA